MIKLKEKILLSASICFGLSALSVNSAFANVTSVTVNNPNNPNITIYKNPDGNNNPNRLQAIPTPPNPPLNGLDGISGNGTLFDITRGFCTPNGNGQFIQINSCNVQSSPGSNVEIGTNTDGLTLNQFLALTPNDRTVLTFKSDNFPDVKLKSLIGLDWFGNRNNPSAPLNTSYDTNYNPANPTNSTFANQWFQQFLATYAITDQILASVGTTKQTLFNTFRNNGGFQRFSDPNISFLNIVDIPDGLQNVTVFPFQADVGLSGFLDATDLFYSFFNLNAAQIALVNNYLTNLGISQGLGGRRFLQAIEVVRIEYQGALGLQESYNYSFSAANSTLAEVSGGGSLLASQTGLYDPSLFAPAVPTPPQPPTSVPEPTGIVALLGLGGLLIANKKKKQA